MNAKRDLDLYDILPELADTSQYPWDHVVEEIQRSATRVAWIDLRINEILQLERTIKEDYHSSVDSAVGERKESEEDASRRERVMTNDLLRLWKELRYWLKESRHERDHLAKVSFNAIQAGMLEKEVEAARLQARTIARVLAHALDALELRPDQRRIAATALREALEDVSTRPLGVSTSGG
jgi:hypothetical protein